MLEASRFSEKSEFAPVQYGEHEFQLLRTGAVGIAAIEESIASAQRSVCLEMYIFKADATGGRIRFALLAARRRGARVRILLDHFGSSELPRDFFAELTQAGVELRFFNPSRVLRVAFRNHRKLCIVDEHLAIVGGFNIGEEYAGDGVQAGWRDLGLKIAGPIVGELLESFGRIFIAARMDRAALIVFARGIRAESRALAQPSLLTSGPGFGGAFLRRVLFRDLETAHNVDVVSAYFAPTWSLRRRLSIVAQRAALRLILPGRSDIGILRLAAQHLYARILRDGARIFEYQPQILHAKLLVIDDVVYVGSSNLDARSLRLNFELLVRLPVPELAKQARELIAADLAHCREVTADEWRRQDHWWRKFKQQLAFWLVTRLDPFLARRRLRTIR